jgi:hypothetical protein
MMPNPFDQACPRLREVLPLALVFAEAAQGCGNSRAQWWRLLT